jgi:hypothetical protein
MLLSAVDLWAGPPLAATVSGRELSMKVLSVTGGVPRYLEEVDPERSAEDNIRRLLFTRGSMLLNEFDSKIRMSKHSVQPPAIDEIEEKIVCLKVLRNSSVRPVLIHASDGVQDEVINRRYFLQVIDFDDLLLGWVGGAVPMAHPFAQPALRVLPYAPSRVMAHKDHLLPAGLVERPPRNSKSAVDVQQAQCHLQHHRHGLPARDAVKDACAASAVTRDLPDTHLAGAPGSARAPFRALGHTRAGDARGQPEARRPHRAARLEQRGLDRA